MFTFCDVLHETKNANKFSRVCSMDRKSYLIEMISSDVAKNTQKALSVSSFRC